MTNKRKPGPAPSGRAPFHTWAKPELVREMDMAAARLTLETGKKATRADVLEIALRRYLKP